MTTQTLTLADLKTEAIEKILQEVADQQITVTVRLPNGKEVLIEAKPQVQPLLDREGCAPIGGKNVGQEREDESSQQQGRTEVAIRRVPLYPTRPQSPEMLTQLIELVALGGDALADSEALYDADWH
jgi:hypothetical protein